MTPSRKEQVRQLKQSMARHIVSLRKKKGLTRQQVQEQVPVSAEILLHLEEAKGNVNAYSLYKVLQFLEKA